jgi:diguanylate cyclase (GGDEF)-like protein/PAS domain S-box-containing protein
MPERRTANDSEHQSKSPLKRTLRILFVEDNPADFELCVRVLRKAQLDFQADLVDTPAAFEEKLHAHVYDVVVADYRLEGWTGVEALNSLRYRSQDTPFILVTGVLGDETAIDCMKQGVDDYVLKDHLSRLPVAINSVLREQFLREARRHAATLLRESEEKFRTLAETIASAIFVYRGTRCEYANRAAQLITGYSREELLELDSWDLVHPDSRDLVIQLGLSRSPGDRSPRRYEAKILTKTGEPKWLDLTSAVVEIGGSCRGLITAFDVTERKLAEEEIRQLAASDPLTGLANYRRLLGVFDSELERSRRTGRSFCLVLLDLDGLKGINDRHGHLTGSRALCRVGSILRTQCRSLDTAARYGGDEFALILPETGAEEARYLARRIVSCVETDGEQPRISVSFGLAACPGDGGSFKDALRVADGGLYLMKGQSRTRVADSA